MACVTLKRSLELEPLYSPTGSAAKRRCTPLTPLFGRNEQRSIEAPRNWTKSKKDRSQDRQLSRVFGEPTSVQSDPAETFSHLPMPSNDELYNRIKEEWKRLKRRRQLKYAKQYSNKHKHFSDGGRGASPSCGSSSGSDNDEVNGVTLGVGVGVGVGQSVGPSPNMQMSGPMSSAQATVRRSSGEGALFTLEQVVTICNKLLVDRDNTLREEYDKALSEKLAEQYDAFVKFTHDQIQSRLSHSASYVS